MTEPRLFALHRDRDISGVSGTGIVADGVRWPDGTVAVHWRGDRPSTVSWNSVEDAEHVHGHGGATRIVWARAEPGPGPDAGQRWPVVQGCCPACNWASLFIGDGGYVTCSRIECPEPDAATTLLERQAPGGPIPASGNAKCGPACAERHTYLRGECALSCTEMHGSVAHPSWSVPCPNFRCQAPADRPCRRTDGSPCSVVCEERAMAEWNKRSETGGNPRTIRQQDTVRTVPDTIRTPDGQTAGQSRTPETPQASEPGQQDRAPDAGWDAVGPGLRKVLDVLLSRVRRGVQTDGEADILAGHVEHLMRSLDQTVARVATLEHVAASNKRHVQLIVPDLERAEAAIDRVRALRDPIAEALEQADYRMDMQRGDLADSVMPVILDAMGLTPPDAVHPSPEQQASGADRADEQPITAQELAHLLADADIQISGGTHPALDTGAAPGTERTYTTAQYLLQHCHITTKET